MTIPIVSIEEVIEGRSIEDISVLKEELKCKIEEYEKENGYPIDLKDEIPDDIEELIYRIDSLKKNR